METDYKDTPVLSVVDLSKSFGGIQALSHVSFALRKGEIHALVGENGAGKSTFLNIISGIYHPNSGEIYLNGTKVDFKNPLSAKRHGIVKVHQETQLVLEMTVAQNIFLGCEPLNSIGAVNFKMMYQKADELLKDLSADFSSKEQVKNLSTAQMQMVEIAKALRQDFNVLALDEPTSSLTTREIEQLFKTVCALKEQGKSIIYITHRLDEIFEIAERATVFRDGKYIGTVDVKDIDKERLIRMMVGRDITDEKYNEKSSATDSVVLEVHHLSGEKFHDINFQLHQGEILGVSGLIGAGRTETMRAVFGADRCQSGEIVVHGKGVNIKAPKDAIRAGIMMIPEDRKLQGIVGILSNYVNVSISNLGRYTKKGIINHEFLKRSVQKLTRDLQVYPDNNAIPTQNLSGGNQQKIVIAKALNVEPNVLILDEPTRGIDVNAKHEIYKLIRQLADAGKSIIMISSELSEILSLSDRILVMYEGKITGEIRKDEATEEVVMHYAMGGM